ncbi:hypothetical protein KIH74_09480 [Kineosporia sp. J2-2]|uniref:Uncharacterized protein n=1 Tax=Kineosporia corallincola TaxID=2835133 RepID=A0ABS5THT4_9ACTN|nr:protealysin inhibitor emfourin [Kineosporia corallincola]MBT0769149.1 hypothetical protein [Kineosporia corallincola]
MLITLRRSGGFAAVPGLSRKLSVDTATLPKGEAEELESAVRAVRVDQLAAQPTPAPGAGDRYVYDLTVADGTTTHTVTVTEPLEDPVGTLIEMLSSYS